MTEFNRAEVFELLGLVHTDWEDFYNLDDLTDTDLERLQVIGAEASQALQPMVDMYFNGERDRGCLHWPTYLAVWDHSIVDQHRVCPYIDKQEGSGVFLHVAKAIIINHRCKFEQLEFA